MADRKLAGRIVVDSMANSFIRSRRLSRLVSAFSAMTVWAKLNLRILVVVLLTSLTACETLDNEPRITAGVQAPTSILVLPPLNNSNDQRATYSYLSTISEPLAEAGYYVLPVAVVDAYLKANGVPNPFEMHQVSLEKYHEILGADAILYITIDRYGQEFNVLNSSTVVKARAKLIDVKTGVELWQNQVSVSRSSNSGNSIAEALVNAVVTQVVKANQDYAHPLSREANWRLFKSYRGLPLGPRYYCKQGTCDIEPMIESDGKQASERAASKTQ